MAKDGRSTAKSCLLSQVSQGRHSAECLSLLGLTVVPDTLGCADTSCHPAATRHSLLPPSGRHLSLASRARQQRG